jgi:single-strand DNA-binding protein
MAGSINKVILIGNLGSHPEIRATQARELVVSFSLMTSESWHDRTSGERRERTEWHHIAIFNKQLAEIAERYLRKGSKVYVEGQLRTRQLHDQEGQQRSTTEIVLSEYRGKLVMLDSR